MGSSHLVDILNLAVYLAWPEDANVKHQFARAIAQRLLDPRPQPPAVRPKDGAYGRFTEGMPSLGSFLNSKHGALRQQAGASKLKDFILNPECTNMIIYHADAFGKAGAIELDVYGLLVQALAEAAGQVWPLKLGTAAELAYAGAQVCLEEQDLVNVDSTSTLNEPVLLTQVMDVLRQSHAEQCAESLPTKSGDFFGGPVCSPYLQICKGPKGAPALRLHLWRTFEAALALHTQAGKAQRQQQAQQAQQQAEQQQQQQQQPQPQQLLGTARSGLSTSSSSASLPNGGQAPAGLPPGHLAPGDAAVGTGTSATVDSSRRQSDPATDSEPPSKMLSLLLDQLVQQSLISAAAATKSKALLEVYEHQGKPKQPAALAKVQQRLAADIASSLTETDESTATLLPIRGPDNEDLDKQPKNKDLRLSFSNEEGAACAASFSEHEPPQMDAISPASAKAPAEPASDADVLAMLDCLPPHVKEGLLHTLSSLPDGRKSSQLVQICADSGTNILLRFADGSQTRSSVSTSMQLAGSALISRLKELETPSKEGEESAMPGSAEELFGPGNRAGIPGTLHRITSVRATAGITGRHRIVGLTYHVKRHVPGIGALVLDLLAGIAQHKGVNHAEEAALSCSLLVVGPPGSGKSTLLRNMNWLLDKRFKQHVSVVDTSADIVGLAPQPHFCLGSSRRFQVAWDGKMGEVLQDVARNHSPQVLMVDDIASRDEAAAARAAAQRGIPVIAAAQARSLVDLLQNHELHMLLTGSGRRGIGLRPQELVRKGAPAFCTLIEVVEHGKLRVHTNLALSIERLLAGYAPLTQLRSFDVGGGAVARFEGGGHLPKAVKQLLVEKPPPPAAEKAPSTGSSPGGGALQQQPPQPRLNPSNRTTTYTPRPPHQPQQPHPQSSTPRPYPAGPRPQGFPPQGGPQPLHSSASHTPSYFTGGSGGPSYQSRPPYQGSSYHSRPVLQHPRPGRGPRPLQGGFQSRPQLQRPASVPQLRPQQQQQQQQPAGAPPPPQPQRGLESLDTAASAQAQVAKPGLQQSGGPSPTFPFQGGASSAPSLPEAPFDGMASNRAASAPHL